MIREALDSNINNRNSTETYRRIEDENRNTMLKNDLVY